MSEDKGQGIVRTGRGEEQPADKERAQTATKTEPGHMPDQPVIKEKKSAASPAIKKEARSDADARTGARSGAEPVMSERLLRAATGPLNPKTGRRPAK
jgi:hypothetical protein